MAGSPPALDTAALRGTRGVDLSVWPPRYDPAYRPDPRAEHRLPEVECAEPAAREALVFAKLVRQVRYAWERSAFYRRKWQEAGVSPDSLKSLDDLARFPVVQKAEPAEVTRIHGTSGTTVFPFGAGAQGQTLQAVQWTRELAPSAFYGTPSYALHFAETARREGIDPRSLGFRVLFFSGEPGAGIPATRALIEQTFGGICVDMGSMAEMSPWMTNGECRHRTGMHLWQDLVYTQVCDPETFRPLPYGAEGTPVYTHLERTSQPMIRLVSGDRARWVDEACPCGRTYPRLPDGLYGRFDDMIIVRGENIYPSAIEDALRAVEGFGGEFRVIVSRRETMDELLVRAEYGAGHAEPGRLDALRATMRERLRARLGVHPVVELVPEGTLPRTEFKARRVIDDRDLYRRGLQR